MILINLYKVKTYMFNKIFCVLYLLMCVFLSACSQQETIETAEKKEVDYKAVPEKAKTYRINRYKVIPLSAPKRRLLEAARLFKLKSETEVNVQENALSLIGQCGESSCEVTFHHEGGFINFRRYSALREQSAERREEFSVEKVISMSDDLLSAVLPDWETRKRNTSVKVDTDGFSSKILYQQFLPLMDDVNAPVLGQTIIINYSGNSIESAWIPLLKTKFNGTVSINATQDLSRFFAPRGLVLDKEYNSYFAYNGPLAEKSLEVLLPGLVVFTQNKKLSAGHNHSPEKQDLRHDHGPGVTDSHHSRRTYYFPVCDNESCDDVCTKGEGNLCFFGDLPDEETTVTPEPRPVVKQPVKTKETKEDVPVKNGEPTPKPVGDDPPEFFGEPIDALLALCTKPATANSKGFSKAGWSGNALITQNDGLMLDKVQYEGNNFAKNLRSALGYKVKTSRGIFECRLEPNSDNNKDCHSNLVEPGLKITNPRAGRNIDYVSIKALYCVEGFPASIDNKVIKPECKPKLLVGQQYIMGSARSAGGGFIDLSDSAAWNPIIEYTWVPPAENCPKVTLDEIVFWSLFDHDLHENNRDIAAFFKDNDTSITQTPILPSQSESVAGTVANFGTPGTYDNFHQKDHVAVSMAGTLLGGQSLPWGVLNPNGMLNNFLGLSNAPLNARQLEVARRITIPGCSGALNGEFACAHYHWRWGTKVGQAFPIAMVPRGSTAGKVLTPAYQKVEAGVGLVITKNSTSKNKATQISPPLSFNKTAEDFDITNGSDLQLLLKVTSKKDTGKIHLEEQIFFR